MQANSLVIDQVMNLTSGLPIIEPKKSPVVEVVEYDLKNLVVQFPLLRLVTGHLISLSGHIQIRKETFAFGCTGKINSLEENPTENLILAKIRIRQVDEEIWVRFNETSVSAQERVDKLLAAIKGDES
jgi:hypothetical protein